MLQLTKCCKLQLKITILMCCNSASVVNYNKINNINCSKSRCAVNNRLSHNPKSNPAVLYCETVVRQISGRVRWNRVRDSIGFYRRDLFCIVRPSGKNMRQFPASNCRSWQHQWDLPWTAGKQSHRKAGKPVGACASWCYHENFSSEDTKLVQALSAFTRVSALGWRE